MSEYSGNPGDIPSSPGTEVDRGDRLVADHVSVHFAGLKALDDVSMSVGQGEIVGLIGPNGSGKTTLLNVFSGVYRPTSGDVYVDGLRCNRRPVRQFAKLGVARTFQNLRLFSNLSVVKNVEVGVALRGGLSGDLLNAEAELILAELNLIEYRDRPAADLPYGVRRRVEIARALATRPRYLLLDEPAAGANGRESEELATFIEHISENYDLGVLVIEHDLRLMMRVAGRITALTGGRKIADGTPEEISNDSGVREAYFGKKGKSGAA